MNAKVFLLIMLSISTFLSSIGRFPVPVISTSSNWKTVKYWYFFMTGGKRACEASIIELLIRRWPSEVGVQYFFDVVVVVFCWGLFSGECATLCFSGVKIDKILSFPFWDLSKRCLYVRHNFSPTLFGMFLWDIRVTGVSCFLITFVYIAINVINYH